MTQNVALITGGGTGIGRATAYALGRDGWAVAIAGRRDEVLRDTLAGLGSEGIEARAIAGNVARPEDCQRMVETTAREFGGLDLLVNNAACYTAAPVLDVEDESWQRQFALNLDAPRRLCRLAYPWLADSDAGSVVNVLSTLAHKAMSGVSAYCASKAALEMLGRCLALEWAPDGIRVNSVSPGVVDTPIHAEGVAAAMAGAHPLGRIGKPEEVARVIAFLASEESAWITGANLDVDGGIRLA